MTLEDVIENSIVQTNKYKGCDRFVCMWGNQSIFFTKNVT